MKKNSIIAVVAVVLLIGAGVVYYLASRPAQEPMAAREDAGLAEQCAPGQSTDAAKPFEVQGTERETVAPPSQTAPAVGAVDRSGPAEGGLASAPNAEEQAASSRQATHRNNTAQPSPAAQETQTQTEDSVVTLGFIDNLCAYIVERFFPPGAPPAQDEPVSTLTVKGLNAHYGVDFAGLSHASPEPETARKEVLDYVMAPLTVHALFQLYGDWFVESLVIAGENANKNFAKGGQSETRGLTPEETAEMLRIDGDKLRSWSNVLAAVVAQPELREQAGRYVRSANRVLAANAEFQQLLGRLRQAGGQKSDMEDNPRLRKAAQTLKQAITAREQARRRITDIARDECKQDCPDNDDILAIVQWAHRRLIAQSNALPALKAAAEEAASLAGKMQSRSRDLRTISGGEAS
ncbi:MAG: hypothetical protein AB7D07_00140 [Desulfovibrionaceae bacterium]